MCRRASQTLQLGSWPASASSQAPAAGATCARMQRAACSACCLTSCISPSFSLESSHGGRSCCTAEELHRQGARGYTGIFSHTTLTWEAVCPPSVFQAACLKRSPYPVLQASRVHKGLFVTPVSVALFLSNETPLPKPRRTWLWKCQAGSAGGEFLLVPPVLLPASSCPIVFLSLLLWRVGESGKMWWCILLAAHVFHRLQIIRWAKVLLSRQVWTGLPSVRPSIWPLSSWWRTGFQKWDWLLSLWEIEVLSSSSYRRVFNVCWIHWEAPPASSLQP